MPSPRIDISARRRFARVCALLLACASSSLLADDRQASATQQVAAAVLQQDAWVGEARLCPSQLMPARAAARSPSATACTTPSSACLARCESGEGEACYWLGQGLQKQHAPDPAYETLFQRSCKLGIMSGCTNRAAGMMHEQSDSTASLQCANRTFEKACAADDPWACTMLGFNLNGGLGVARNPERSLEVLRKSCKFGTDDPACTAAQNLKQQIMEDRAAAKK